MNSSSGSPIDASTSVISSRFTPGANAFSFSFFFTDETFIPSAFSGRTSADATSSPDTASACTTALDIRSVRYRSYACASTPFTIRSSTPSSRSHDAASSA